MFDLDTIQSELPPGSRLGNIGCCGENELHTLKPGTWVCTLLPQVQRRGQSPVYAIGYGVSPSLAFAKAKAEWNASAQRETARLKPPTKRDPSVPVKPITLAELGFK